MFKYIQTFILQVQTKNKQLFTLIYLELFLAKNIEITLKNVKLTYEIFLNLYFILIFINSLINYKIYFKNKYIFYYFII